MFGHFESDLVCGTTRVKVILCTRETRKLYLNLAKNRVFSSKLNFTSKYHGKNGRIDAENSKLLGIDGRSVSVSVSVLMGSLTKTLIRVEPKGL
jgi:hypothetical protein